MMSEYKTPKHVLLVRAVDATRAYLECSLPKACKLLKTTVQEYYDAQDQMQRDEDKYRTFQKEISRKYVTFHGRASEQKNDKKD